MFEKSSRTTVGRAAALAALLVLASGTAVAGPSGAATSSPQREIDAYLRAHPGGTQVSDNAVAYRDGDVVIVFPDPGASSAPVGLGDGVRRTALAAGVEASVTEATSSVHGCPSGTIDDWYCFYTDSNFGGRRLQFLNTCADWAADWGFDNMTSSWVNTNPRSQIVAWDYAGGTALWIESASSEDNWVGSSRNDRMSYWTRSNC